LVCVAHLPVHRILHARPLTTLSFNHTSPTEIYTLSLHDALPISPVLVLRLDGHRARRVHGERPQGRAGQDQRPGTGAAGQRQRQDRKSTRLNSSHVSISYAVFCLKKKKKTTAHACQPHTFRQATL